MKYYTYDMLELNGRLGNQLWQIASTIGVSRKNGGTARFRPDWEYRQFFSVPDFYFDPVPSDEPVYDGGTEYLQQTKYFEFMEDEIRGYFEPTMNVRMYLKENYEKFFGVGHKTALHVRRGDYLKHPEIFPPATQEYYRAATDLAFDENPTTTFILFSDDLRWCLNNLRHLGLDGRTFIPIEGRPRPVEVVDRKGDPQDQYDLFLMSMCDSHIISNSTFSWWGGFLANENPGPIYPDPWFLTVESTKMPEHWRKIEC